MTKFVHSNSVLTCFGEGAVKEHLPLLLTQYGERVMLVYGKGSIKKNGIYDEVSGILERSGKTVTVFPGIMSNPTWEKVLEGAQLAREKNIDLILAVGGGSVSDCAKMISAQAATGEDLWTMKFDFGVTPVSFIPLGVIVTASGTGSDQNNTAVITNTALRIKAGMKGALPEFALLDPAYTLTVPMKQVISGAFDSLTHCMEDYFGMPHDDNLSDRMNEAVQKHIVTMMRRLVQTPEDLTVRGELMRAASVAEDGSLRIGKAHASQAHQIEHQVAAYTDCNHGEGLAVIIPVLYKHWYKYAPERFARWAVRVWDIPHTGDDLETARLGVKALEEFVLEMGLPDSFRKMGITGTSFFNPCAWSTPIKQGTCHTLSVGEIYDILTEC